MAVDLGFAMGLEPAKAIEYFESKGYKIGFRWQDVAAEAHAKAFTVAGVMKVDVLQDIRQALTSALKKGDTFETFQKQIVPVLERKGWLGKGMIVDPETGEIEGKRLNARRLQTIYQTNMQSAYMAGRYATQMEQVDTHPWWEYVAVLDSRTRPAHRALAGSIYRYDDPFWQTFYPPNGYRCRCRVRTRTRAYVEQNGIPVRNSDGDIVEVEIVDRSGNKQPAIAYQDPATGKKLLPDPGFGSNPGANWIKPFTPPPSDSLPTTFPTGVELPSLPAPTRAPATELLPAGLPPQDYAASFMRQFGMKPGESKAFRDVTSSPVAISEDLFKAGDGTWKADKDGRGVYMNLLAQAIQAPDEVWLRWEESRASPGAWLLKRRYIKSWVIDDQDAPQYGLSVFEFGQDGWSGSTAMMANVDRSADARKRYIEKQRDGFLAYRK